MSPFASTHLSVGVDGCGSMVWISTLGAAGVAGADFPTGCKASMSEVSSSLLVIGAVTSEGE